MYKESTVYRSRGMFSCHYRGWQKWIMHLRVKIVILWENVLLLFFYLVNGITILWISRQKWLVGSGFLILWTTWQCSWSMTEIWAVVSGLDKMLHRYCAARDTMCLIHDRNMSRCFSIGQNVEKCCKRCDVSMCKIWISILEDCDWSVWFHNAVLPKQKPYVYRDILSHGY
jgi:hypothetical protein